MKKIITGILAAGILTAAIGIIYYSNQPYDNHKETIVSEIHMDYPYYDTAEHLVHGADLIFYGTVENISYEMLDIREKKDSETDTDEMPYTLYTLHVEKLFQGSADGKKITIKVPGGIFEDQEYVLEDGPELLMGNTYLILAQSYENTYPSLLNSSQSSYDINAPQPQTDSGEQQINLADILAILEENDL